MAWSRSTTGNDDGIEANENKICKINGFITDEKFSCFEITNVKYTTIKETAINTSVENISNIVVNEYTSINQNENLLPEPTREHLHQFFRHHLLKFPGSIIVLKLLRFFPEW